MLKPAAATVVAAESRSILLNDNREVLSRLPITNP